MTAPHTAVVTRLSADFAAISRQLQQVSTDLAELDRILTGHPLTSAESPVTPQPAAPPVTPPSVTAPPAMPPAAPKSGAAAPPVAPPPAMPVPVQSPVRPYWPQYPPPSPFRAYPQAPTAKPPKPRKERSEGWIGKLLAVAGVAVTLIGVVLLLVLAAQAGILRPEFRVAAGAALAGALVGAGWWLAARPGGRVGGIALVATGVAAAYMDVIAVTTIYDWVSAPVALIAASFVAGGGLTLARRWDSQHLGLLVLVPLIVLAPVVADGVSLLLVAFMLALAAASLPVQLGKDWIWLHTARIAAAVLPLLVALAARFFDSREDLWLAGACGIAAVIGLIAALVLLPSTTNRAAMALLTAAATLPVLSVNLAVDRVVAALMSAALAAALMAVVLIGDRLPGVPGIVRQVFSATAAVAALIAVTAAFDGTVAGPVLLAMAVVTAVAGRHDVVGRCAAVGFAVISAVAHLAYSPPDALFAPTRVGVGTGISTLVSSILLVGAALAIAGTWDRTDNALWVGAGAVTVYAVTTFTVTAGMLVAPGDGGFYAGHMAATIIWIAMAAALFGLAARRPKDERSVPIGGGLGLVAAAMAKLFLFDLGTLDGIFRVAVFIVVGLILLGMGAGYARLLERQDQQTVTTATDNS